MRYMEGGTFNIGSYVHECLLLSFPRFQYLSRLNYSVTSKHQKGRISTVLKIVIKFLYFSMISTFACIPRCFTVKFISGIVLYTSVANKTNNSDYIWNCLTIRAHACSRNDVLHSKGREEMKIRLQ